MDSAELEKRFRSHNVPLEDIDTMEWLRAQAKFFAEDILDRTLESREQSLALTKLEEAVFWAIAGLARNGSKPRPCVSGNSNA